MTKNIAQKLEVQVDNNNPLNIPLAPIHKAVPVASTAVSASGTWITDRAWVCGLFGALTVVLCAIIFSMTGALEKGLFLFGIQFTDNRTDTLLAALFIITAVMLTIELTRMWMWEGRRFFQLDP